MLQDLPVEVLQQIIGYLPSATSIFHLASTCRILYSRLSADNYAVFRSFVQTSFPSIQTPRETTAWRDIACILTSRSRAWDRRAFIARECIAPLNAIDHNQETLNHKSGYVPAIDSYESWDGGSLASRKEVLAWGAAGRLRTRIVKDGLSTWSSWHTDDDHRPENDILDVTILRPGQNRSRLGETIIIRRHNRQVAKVNTCAEANSFSQMSVYSNNSRFVDCMDVSSGIDPILALCNRRQLLIFPVHADTYEIKPSSIFKFEQDFVYEHRKRCVKFLSETKIVVGVQYLEGREKAPIMMYDIDSRSSSHGPLAASASITPSSATTPGRQGTTCIAQLGSQQVRSDYLFLSGSTDGIVRLHDTRTALDAVAEYTDAVDDGQILSLLAIGHERIMAGSHQNACLKIFDLRMTKARVYSYLDSRPRKKLDTQAQNSMPSISNSRKTASSNIDRNINIFLSVGKKFSAKLWEPLPTKSARNLSNYRGSVYSLSSPSPMSPSVYAGIEGHVMQLDFVASDDLQGQTVNLNFSELNLRKAPQSHVFNLSCYERPREGCESTDTVLLRKQAGLNLQPSVQSSGSQDVPVNEQELEEGWDNRWRLTTHERSGDRGSHWGRDRPL